MRRIALTMVLLLLWIALVLGFVLRYPDIENIERHLVANLSRARIGHGALVLMRHGRIVADHRFGSAAARRSANGGKPPKEPAYQVASVSKAVTAFGVMQLVRDGRLHLDEPVMRHLKRWRFPGSERYRDRVTARHLLSHTAGLDDGLGYSGFAPGERVQTLVESLSDPRHPIRITREPGTALAYSGGGYTVLQLLIEDITGQPFDESMKHAVLRPLGMSTATFDLDELPQPPIAFDKDVKPAPTRRHVALAAVSLYATPNDMAALLLALPRDEQMRIPQPGTSGRWGLGLTLYEGGIIGHDGGSPPAWGAMLRVNPRTGNGMALLISGGRGAVNQLAHDWLYAETGIITAEARRQRLYDRLAPASAAILLGALAIIATMRRAFRTTGAS